MKISKDNKGITLVTLVITIIVIMILTFTSAFTGEQSLKNAKFIKVKSQMEIMQTYVSSLYSKYQKGDNSVLELGRTIEYNSYEDALSIQDQYVAREGENNSTLHVEDYRLYKAEDNIFDIDGIEEDFLVNIKERDIRLAFGIQHNEKLCFTLKDFELSNVDIYTPLTYVSYDLDDPMIDNNTGKLSIKLDNFQFWDSNKNNTEISRFMIIYSKDNIEWEKEKFLNIPEEYILELDDTDKCYIKITDIDGNTFTFYENIEQDTEDFVINTKEDNSTIEIIMQ